MALFGRILAKLGLGDKAASAPSAKPAAPPPTAGRGPVSATRTQAATPVPVVDVVAQLEARAAANPQKLNWRTSIVDLLKLLDIDSSYASRKELAAELGCPSELMADSAKMNTWLHKTVLARMAANGGNIPRELLD